MEFFTQTKAVKLKSHLKKYLTADQDQISTRQRSGGATRNSWWRVELVETNPHVVRLKSCYNRYLTASDHPFLLGMAGRKVLQTLPENHEKDLTIEWQPIMDGFRVKLKAFDGTYLRANGGTPPWRNTVTHDSPHAAAMHDWVVWGLEAVEVPDDEVDRVEYLSMVSRFSPTADELSGLLIGPQSPATGRPGFSGSASPRWLSMKKMEIRLYRGCGRKKNEEMQAKSNWILRVSCTQIKEAPEDGLHGTTIQPWKKIDYVVKKEDPFVLDSSSPTSSHSSKSSSFSRQKSNNSSPKGSDGRLIYFHIANENGETDEGCEELCILFKGNEVKELTKRLEGELGLNGLTICTRSPLNGTLYPLRLHLPPNDATMQVIVVPPSSKVHEELGEAERSL